MARIRIVDEWLRSPASPPSQYRSIMVVAEAWAEQRVMMRAYADSVDQTRPTITLHGVELAIGPAGVDPNGPWGIHVQPPVDGRAQELAEQLVLAARRLAGSKGNAPRLSDEPSPFERKRTNNWAPGTPRDPPGTPGRDYYEPAAAASQATAIANAGWSAPLASSSGAGAGWAPPSRLAEPAAATGAPPAAQYVPAPVAQYVPPPAAHVVGPPVAHYVAPSAIPSIPAMVAATPANPDSRLTPIPVPSDGARRRRGWTSPAPAAGPPLDRTALGYAPGAGAQTAVMRLGLRPGVASRLARLATLTLPADFEISKVEREVLNQLGEADHLSARAVGTMVGVPDPVAWMEALMAKLDRYGLDLIGPGDALGGEPTYVLRR